MATPKKEYICCWCQKPLKGYQIWKRHERECPLNPANASEVVPEPARVVPEPAAAPVVSPLEAIEPEPAVSALGDQEAAEVLGESVIEAEVIPDEPADQPADDSLVNLVALEVAKHLMVYEQRILELNQNLRADFNSVLESWKGEVARLPELIDSSVANFMLARGFPDTSPAPVVPNNGGMESPIPGQEVQVVSGPNNFLANITKQIDFGQILTQIVAAQGGGNINTAIARILTGKVGKSAEPAQAKYISRGYSQAQSALRMKGIDRVAQAKALQSSANLMLGNKLNADERGRQIGIKSYVDTFLEGLLRSEPGQQIIDQPGQGV